MNNYLVCFIKNGGGLAVSHTCSDNDKSFWAKEGYFILDNDGSVFAKR
jgi:hypothetical protein